VLRRDARELVRGGQCGRRRCRAHRAHEDLEAGRGRGHEPARVAVADDYRLTDAGREALRDWLAQPSAFTRIQSEPIVRLLAAEYVDPEVLERSLAALRAPIAESHAALDKAEAVARTLPHRERVLAINHRLARRILDAHSAWLDEAEAELRDAAARRR
jgi:DNA-binding PadR family transcriptional regulator